MGRDINPRGAVSSNGHTERGAPLPLTASEHFGPAADAWGAAINALHAFAQATKCPPGGDVISWFDGETSAFQRAVQERFEQRPPTPTLADDGTGRDPSPHTDGSVGPKGEGQ